MTFYLVLLALLGISVLPDCLCYKAFDVEFYKPQDCQCEKTDEASKPICGTDDRNYYSLEYMKCINTCKSAKTMKAYDGICKSSLTESRKSRSISECDECAQYTDYQQICASDGKTYLNPMQLDCYNRCQGSSVTSVYDGACLGFSNEMAYGFLSSAINASPRECFCEINDYYEPVCGTDSKTYKNPSYVVCMATCSRQAISVAHRGACIKDIAFYPNGLLTTSKSCKCTIDFIPNLVCASDGRTYSSSSYVHCLNKCENRNLAITRSGNCIQQNFNKLSLIDLLKNKPYIFRHLAANQLTCINNCPATFEIKPVCASDGVTYENSVQLTCMRNCVDKGLSEVATGACLPTVENEMRECECPSGGPTDTVVCATDNRIYPNLMSVTCMQRCKYPTLRALPYCPHALNISAK